MAQQHSQTQRVQTTTMDINMVAERDTTTTAPRLSTPRATNPRTGGRPSRGLTGGQRPENRHDRYASLNAGHVHDGAGDQASSDVSLRQQPVPVPSQQRAGRCSNTRGLRWPALKADSTTTRHTRTHPAQRTLTVDKNVSQA